MGNTQPPSTDSTPPEFQHTVPETALERSVRNWPCPADSCPASFERCQEQERHILSHLPHWICCPDPGCFWRGDRSGALKRHLRSDHPSSSQEPDKKGLTIYDPKPLIKGIKKRFISIEEAQSVAKSKVKNRAQELGKLEIWGNLWGRRSKHRD
jgi:hypothetical protein